MASKGEKTGGEEEAKRRWQHRLVACHLERCIECYTIIEAPPGAGEVCQEHKNTPTAGGEKYFAGFVVCSGLRNASVELQQQRKMEI